MKTLVLQEFDQRIWEAFLSGKRPVTRASLLRSWERVRDLGVDPEGRYFSEQVDLDVQVKARRERLGPLLSVAAPILSEVEGQMARHDFVLLLADADGVILEKRAGGAFAAEAQRLRLVSGSHWSEQARGTNAIGTVLAERAPVTVAGCAHYARPNHDVVCYASPICDPFGDTLAVLDATSFIDGTNDFVQVAVETSARAIEQALHIQAYSSSGHASLNALEHVLRRCPTPALLMERSGVVRLANVPAQRLLHHMSRDEYAAHSQGLSWERVEEALTGGAPVDVDDLPPSLSLSFRVTPEPVYDDRGRLWAALLFFEPLRRISSPGLISPPPEPLPPVFAPIRGSDRAFLKALHQAAVLAPSNQPVLIQAERGAGKALLGEVMHKASLCPEGPLKMFSCADRSHEDLIATLLGPDSPVLAAHTGTLFLDEITALPPLIQDVLAALLDTRRWPVSFDRLHVPGFELDVRLIATSTHPLEMFARQGDFSARLHHQLNVARVCLPPLRQRADLEELAQVFLHQLSDSRNSSPVPSLSAEVLAWMRSYLWPGNVWELKQALRHAIQQGHSKLRIEIQDLPSFTELVQAIEQPAQPTPSAAAGSLAELEAEGIKRALSENNGNVSRAAKALGVARSTLYRMMKRHNL